MRRPNGQQSTRGGRRRAGKVEAPLRAPPPQLFGKHFPIRRDTEPEGATVRHAPGRFLLPESGLARGSTWQSQDEELPERGTGYRSAFTASWIWRRATSRAIGGRPMNLFRPSGQTKRCSAIASSVRNGPFRPKFWLAVAIALGALCAETGQALAGYLQTNLVSDIPGLATITDPLLVNPWGMS